VKLSIFTLEGNAVRLALIVISVLLLSGCATQIMQGFVGQPVQNAMLKYGPPMNVMDMPDGTRAFQWEIKSSVVMPGTSTAYGTANIYAPPGSSFATVSGNSTTTYMPGQVINSRCLYTMYGQWQAARNAWIFTGYEKPPLIC
jgi:hypothetical protein